jgi:hypothetical protein
MVSSRTTINANGELVRAEEGESLSTAVLPSGGSTVDVFGFNLEWRQFFVVVGILSFMIGLRGSKLF